MASNVSAVVAQAAQKPEAPTKASASEVSKEVFLELLVAQIRHQDPLNPADGTEYMAQLADFSGLEQMIAVKEELKEMHETLRGMKEQSQVGTQPAEESETEGGSA